MFRKCWKHFQINTELKKASAFCGSLSSLQIVNSAA